MLPDYSQYPHYQDYRQGFTGQRADMLTRRQFRKGRKGWQPPQPQQESPQTPSIIQTSYPPQATNTNRNLATHPFFDPAESYRTSDSMQSFEPGSLPYNIYGTEQSPEGYYYGVMNELGFGGMDARSQAAQGMYRDYARGYQAAKLKNGDLWFPEYMGMQDVAANVRQLSNRQLGIDENVYGGRDRWSLRGY